VILGSGDIGLIMARRMTLEGAHVKAVCEIMPYSSGLARNIEQCLNDFDIPLLLSHTVVKLHGNERLLGVTIAKVDESRTPTHGTEEFIPCDTLLLSCGLIPENELSKQAEVELSKITGGAVVDQGRETSASCIFSCGNVLHVHDLVDFVSSEAEIAGKSAAEYIRGERVTDVDIPVTPMGKIRYTVPQRITKCEDFTLYFRVSSPSKNAKINVYDGEKLILSKKKARLFPSEMEALKIKGELLTKNSALRICLEEEAK
jgi:pyruvate/2-oxoglutarate dehydrogenase complex dihydrolipoamide dehydrogenase (E3) component